MSAPNVLEYARYHGLAIDHCAALASEMSALVQQISYDTASDAPKENYEVTSNDILAAFPRLECPLVEDRFRLTVKQSDLLRSAIAPSLTGPGSPSPIVWRDILPDHKRIRKLYLDPPLLHTGHEDVQKDVYRARKGVNINAIIRDIRENWKARSSGDASQDAAYNDTQLDCTTSAENNFVVGIFEEKFRITETAATILAATLRVSHADIAELTFQDCQQPKCRIRYVSSLPNLTIDNPSDHSDASTHCLKDSVESSGSAHSRTLAANDRSDAMQEDTGPPDGLLREEMHSSVPVMSLGKTEDTDPDQSTVYSQSSKAVLKRLPSSDMPPLAARTSKRRCWTGIEAGMSKTLSSPFSSQIRSTDSTMDARHWPMLRQSPDLLTKVETAVDHEIGEANIEADMKNGIYKKNTRDCSLQQHARNVKPQVSLTKVVSKELPPTDFYSTNNFEILLNKTLREVRTLEVDREQECKMNWYPRPILSSSRVLNEQIEGDSEHLKKIKTRTENVVKSSHILWKSPGPKVLEISADDIDDAKIPMSTLSNVRSGSMLEPDEADDIPISSEPTELRSTRVASAVISDRTFGPSGTSISCPRSTPHASERKPKENNKQMEKSVFSAATSLSTFLDLRGKKFKKAKLIHDERALEMKDDPIELTQQSSQSQNPESGLLAKCIDTKTTYREETRLPLYEPLTWNRSIVINNSLLESNAGLVRSCESHGQSLLNVIYRDLNIQDKLSPDIILGPNTCLIITNAQSLKEQGLPGQKPASQISKTHKKILELSCKYELVIVIIGWPTMTDVDTLVIAEMSAFCTVAYGDLKSHVQPVYIPHTTVDELKNATKSWVWHAILKHSFPTTAVRGQIARFQPLSLIEDETTWELFLRKAGMNVIAAQIVLKIVKFLQSSLQDNATTGTRSKLLSALSYFAQMGLEERLRIFGSIISPRVLEIASSVLDNTDF